MINYNTFTRKVSTAIKNPKMLLIKPLIRFSFLFNDEFYIKLNFRLRMGKKLELKNPQTFNEKLQWLKLYYRKLELTNMVDKYESKKYVADLIGEKYIIPTLGVWDSFEEINFDTLPSKFVLKTTHDQGGVIICKNKDDFDYEFARKKMVKHLKSKHYYLSREWPYKNIKPRIIAEKYMMDEHTKELIDYKFFCFHGIPRALYLGTERQEGKVKFNFYDMEFCPLDITQAYEKSKKKFEKPKGFDKMVELAKIISTDHPHVRVDFYDVNGSVYFGELTFFHHGGHTPFNPEEWDYKFGSWINLPDADGNYNRD
jgi:hypothetical protein